MNDEDIATLILQLQSCGEGRKLCWVTVMATRHDGPGYQGSHYLPVYREVTGVSWDYDDGDGIKEPVAFLGDGDGGHVALLACEATEFVMVSPIFGP